MQHSQIILAMKDLQAWRLVILWVWLMSLTAAPVAVAVAVLVAG